MGRHLVVAGLLAASTNAAACARITPSEAPTRTPARGPFSLHEWGLFAVDAAAADRAIAATEAAGGWHAASEPSAPDAVPGERPARRASDRYGMGNGIGTLGVKPVLYVHLDEGTDRARFSVRLGVPSATLLERWPEGADLAEVERARAAGWREVGVRRGACTHPASPPTAESPVCLGVRDHFCEAAEIPRYTGGLASCLDTGSAESEVLFYRAGDLPTRHLPLRMVKTDDGWTIERVGDAPLEGPVFWLTTGGTGTDVHIRRLGLGDLGHPLDPSIPGQTQPDVVRTELLAEAVRRGLSQAEAEAFVDAWSPAFFDHCTRTGPEASGTIPTSLRQSERSLLYFAPQSVIDAMLPLTTDPPAHAIHRVFLVRWVDGAALLPERSSGAAVASANDGATARAGFEDVPAGALIGRAVNRTVVRIGGPPDVRGGLSPEVVTRVVRRNIQQIRHCYEAAVEARPSMDEGRITVASTIAPTGSVVSAAVTDDTFHDAGLAACVTSASRRWAYPVPEPAGVVVARVTYALAMQPPDP